MWAGGKEHAYQWTRVVSVAPSTATLGEISIETLTWKTVKHPLEGVAVKRHQSLAHVDESSIPAAFPAILALRRRIQP